MCDSYNGWVNRETWATSLHLSNDEGMYLMVREWANDAIEEEGERAIARRTLADRLRVQFEEWEQDVVDAACGEGEQVTSGMALMFGDIGSLYRVNWDDVAEGWVDEAIAEAKS